MVSSKISLASNEPSFDIPEGRYKLVGWEIDTTGRRLIDEICQIAGYAPEATFAQYIMPFGDLNPVAQRRYNIKIITFTRYRMLKDLKTNKFLKTKSEISALVDFLAWLEELKGQYDGLILAYHEVKKIAPLMLLEAFKRYGLYDRFAAVVKGFCNTHRLAENKCAKTMKSFSLKVLSRNLLGKEEDFGHAFDRAMACYNIIHRLGEEELQNLQGEEIEDTKALERHVAEMTLQFARSTEAEEKDLIDLKNLIDRQNTFRPVFQDLMRFDWVSRLNTSRLRRKLVENNIDFNQLKTSWNMGGRMALQELLKQVKSASKREYSDLLTIFDCYFDPNKKSVTGKFYRRHRRSPKMQDKIDKQNKSNVARNSSSEAWANSETGSPQSGTSGASGTSGTSGASGVSGASSRSEIQVSVSK